MLWIILSIIAVIVVGLFGIRHYRYRKIASYRGRLLSKVNRVRKRRGLTPLGRVKFLDSVARRHSKGMAKRRSCDHHGFHARAKFIEIKAGLSYVAENCYQFPGSRYTTKIARRMVEGWCKSRGHRKNILNSRFRRTGIGITVRGHFIYATQIFTE